jgi:transposase
MNGNNIIALGIGLESPWQIVGQLLDTAKTPHELRLTLKAARGSKFPCPECGHMCKAHDFKEMTWRHLNFFQHHCYITAAVPRVRCPDHGVKRIKVPWARKGSKFTLLFEQAAMILAREMPVLAAARILEINDKRLWRIIRHYVNQAVKDLDLSGLQAVALDETKSRRGHRYVTVFIDLDRQKHPVVFATPGKGKNTLKAFKKHLVEHDGKGTNILEVVSDMSGAFISGIKAHFTNSAITVDWFHVVQLFSKAVDEVRRKEAKEVAMPRATRWATLKAAESRLTEKQIDALAELEAMELKTAEAWRIKELLRWVRRAATIRAARWRLTWFLNLARELCNGEELLAPVRKALRTVEKYREEIVSRWVSEHSNGRLEALNGIFQAAKARARGYRNDETFITMIYLLAAPIQNLMKST